MQHDTHLFDRAEHLLTRIAAMPRPKPSLITVLWWMVKLTSVGVAL